MWIRAYSMRRSLDAISTVLLLDELPPATDPCGEKGEFHTCVYAGPMFAEPLEIETGETVTRDPFVWADFRMTTNRMIRSRITGRRY